ncbi:MULTISPECIES: CaiB/BaiF CoA-transferase family protein [unclassified Beijerinckia]|uniref:CaiB/BaiF CoA transferase family protein n=1 Tax=unclassified Beijerinckia TaxID=2638183 RepID=UPI000899B0BF|nr:MULTISPECIES: CaiB/BaiF CoA-transferase family protein [unclassified Beijerinckia]MDH7799183.1 alpha-methylacyl-CoA racemase [Beijerinckia sp. GAS462]SED92678.1 alpha-methylacyl-CoA racemase [Beijerinckia sp. 28-YEA-48]
MSETPTTSVRRGPLTGVRVVEFGGLGPAPFAAMLMADLGADVLRIDRPGKGASESHDITSRNRRYVELDLKRDADVASALALLEHANVLIEGFRPGVMERLGLGPDTALARNPKLVYGRMTGWGQTGPLAEAAGHDINYIAITGALGAIGPGQGRPVPPLNLVGDYGGGALYLVVGALSALLSSRETGRGQVIDCAMCDGVSHLLSLFHTFQAMGQWVDRREANLLDGGAHFYGTYECADGKYVAVGALEPQFYAELCKRAGLEAHFTNNQNDPVQWPALKRDIATLFRQRSRAEWCTILEGTDACFSPVLSLREAPEHPHLSARGSYIDLQGVKQAAPAPRFSGTPTALPLPPPKMPTSFIDALHAWSR